MCYNLSNGHTMNFHYYVIFRTIFPIYMYIKRITLKEFSLIQHNFGGIMCKAGLVCITNNKLLGCRHGGGFSVPCRACTITHS